MTRFDIFKHMIAHHEDILHSFLRLYKACLLNCPAIEPECTHTSDFQVGREIYVGRIVIKSDGPILKTTSRLRVYFNITSISGHSFNHCFKSFIGIRYDVVEDAVLAEISAILSSQKGGDHEA